MIVTHVLEFFADPGPGDSFSKRRADRHALEIEATQAMLIEEQLQDRENVFALVCVLFAD